MKTNQHGYIQFDFTALFIWIAVIAACIAGAIVGPLTWWLSDDGDIAESCETEGRFILDGDMYECKRLGRMVEHLVLEKTNDQ